MSSSQKLLLPVLLTLSMGLLVNCSEDPSAPLENDTLLSNEEAIDTEILQLSASGVQVEGCIGVFSIGWNQSWRPRFEEPEVIGESFAVGFAEPTDPEPPLSPDGIDMGTVYLNCPDIQVELIKRECLNQGVVYSSFARPFPDEGTIITFFPDASYEFEVTGSDLFDPITFNVTSPPALIEITSHSRGDWIAPDEDLTITWEGGYADGQIELFFVRQQRHQGGRPPRPPHPQPEDGIRVTLEQNTGEYTLPASELQELLQGQYGNMIMCGVAQHNVTEVAHGSEYVLGIVRDADGVSLHIR